MTSPYEDLPSTAFWRSSVAEKSAFAIEGLWDPKFALEPDEPVSTLGSCFAQHIGRTLVAAGYNWFDAEPAPHGSTEALRSKYNYGVFSARTGNIYTAAALRQWVTWSLGDQKAPAETWSCGGRTYDPFRPGIEPAGFESADEMFRSREVTLEAVRALIGRSSVLVFTMGLTEAWINREHGYVYAGCPGTSAGEYDANLHAFKNYDYAEILSDLTQTIQSIRSHNAQIRILLTVSPVPLTATASGDHVLTATTYSKSVLRAVAGALAKQFSFVDYFPSYEIITSFPFRGCFFEPNLRSVSPFGVKFVMDSFLSSLHSKFGTHPVGQMASGPTERPAPRPRQSTHEDVVCEEQLLDAFSRE